MTTYRIGIIGAFIVAAALTRLVPHPPNFTPIIAVALFGAATFSSRWLAFAVPLAAMLLSDVALEITTRLGILSGWLAKGYGLHRGMFVVYGILLLVTALGFVLRKRKHIVAIVGTTLISSVLFYLFANLGVWAAGELYPRTMAGLAACYLAALPFLKWSLLGNLFYVSLLFGGLALMEQSLPRLVRRHPVGPRSMQRLPT